MELPVTRNKSPVPPSVFFLLFFFQTERATAHRDETANQKQGSNTRLNSQDPEAKNSLPQEKTTLLLLLLLLNSINR